VDASTIDTSVVMVGMPETGKTTFIAALYHQLTDPREDDTARLRSQPATRAYLEVIRTRWLNGEPVAHTQRDSGEIIDLDVRVGNSSVLLRIPDVSGETFQGAFVERQIDDEITTSVAQAAGVLLFTTGDHARPRVLLTEAAKLLDKTGEDREAPNEGKAFDHTRVPGEVHLVDLLQWVVDTRDAHDGPLLRCAILLSAWDKMPPAATPDAWLTGQMPMLARFLTSHAELIEWQVYGLSAQGGDYAEQSLEERNPQERAYVVDGSGTKSRDLWKPVGWACAL
jgi:hypothetical protein